MGDFHGAKMISPLLKKELKQIPYLNSIHTKEFQILEYLFNQVPVMAMLRLPTKRSNGTANLHSGAICTGIDIGTGITTYSMHNKPHTVFSDTYELIESTMDLKTNLPLSGIQIPSWNSLLEIALKCQKASGLGYIGVTLHLMQRRSVVFGSKRETRTWYSGC